MDKNYYNELLKQLEKNPLPLTIPKLPEAVNNSENIDKPKDGPVDYSLVSSSPNSNPLFGCFHFVIPPELNDPEEIYLMLDQYLDTEDLSNEFTYYNCSWTVVHIENLIYNLYNIRLFQECLSDDEIKYHVYIQKVDGDYFEPLNFFENIRSLFFEIEESPKSITDTPVNMDNILKALLDLEEEKIASLENRVNNAFSLLKNNDDTKNKEIVKYKKSEVIKTIVELSVNEQSRQYFTSDYLLALLEYLISINSNYDLTLAATRCVIIFYNISLTEILSKDIIDPLLDHLFYLASNDGNVFDMDMRKKSAQTIINIIIKYKIISDERKNQLGKWLKVTNLLVEKEIIKYNLRNIISIKS